MRARVQEVRFGVRSCTARLPFRFGVSTLTWAPSLAARVVIESEAGRAVGHAENLLVPKWFEKDPSKSLRDDVEGLVASAVAAGELAERGEESTLFELWWRLYRERVHVLPQDAPDRLLRGFGVALVERAAIDAWCRASGTSFFDALRGDLFGLRAGEVYAELEGWTAAEGLPAAPLAQVDLRHTIGLVDPLRAATIPAGERVDDGLPEALEEVVAAYAPRWFKLKLRGDPELDLPRCLAFAEVLEERVGEDWALTVDGNEQFESPEDLVATLRRLGEDPRGRALLERLRLIEQPLSRLRSFEESARGGLAELASFAPVILDEADHGIEALPRALELGYGGVSTKNCKGVLRAVLHRGLCAARGAVQSAEDLTNLGVLALQQDLCTVAALGIPHVERNGHHYFRGLDHLSRREARSAVEVHGDLWHADGVLRHLRVEAGSLQLGSLQGVGFGYASEIDWESRTPLEAWSWPPERA